MINEIKRRLEAGEAVELECIDVEAISASNRSYAETLLGSQLILSHVFANKIIFKNQLFIYEPELKYFKIKELAPTFDDLVDVVVQAAKDGLLEINMLNSEFITASIPGDHDSAFVTCWRTKQAVFESSINKVKSLYTETFVINDVSDVLNCKRGARLVFSNGVDSEFLESYFGGLRAEILFLDSGKCCNVPIELLKGATVTQRKGVS